MKIGILTYHFSINFGAVLQCYALQKAFQLEGRDVYVINFVSKAQRNNIALYRTSNNFKSIIKNILLLPFHKQRKKRNELYRKFLDTYLNSTRHVGCEEDMKMLVREMKLDCIFVGSDQVWNPRIEDFNKVFFLPSFTSIKKVGYAVSLGVAKKDDLTTFSQYISAFDYVSVREKSALPIVKNFYDSNIDVVLDPTFLISTSHWKYMAGLSKGLSLPEKYVLCYFLNQKRYGKNIKVAKEIAGKQGCKLLLIDPRVSKLSILNNGIISAGPLEFLQYIDKATLVVTDSFHGTVFSVLLNKPFYSIDNNPGGNDTRKKELLENLSLGDCYLSLDKINRNVLPHPNYAIVNEKLDKIRVELINNLLRI